MPLFLVELNIVCSKAGQFPSQAEPCGHIQFSCGCFHKIAIVQAMLQSDLGIGLCRDLRPYNWGCSAIDLGCRVRNPILP